MSSQFEDDDVEDVRDFWRTHGHALQAAFTRREELHSAALDAKDETHRKKHEATVASKDKVAGRLWKLLSPLPDTTEADKPTVAELLEDPEAVIAPFEGHPSRKRRRMERQIDRGDAESDSSDSE
jgi:hypothetical protein